MRHHPSITSAAPPAAAVPLDLERMRAAALAACALMKSLSHPDRLLLLCQLSTGQHTVGELEQLLGIRQPSLSQQLGVLRADALVVTRREGKRIFYSIAGGRTQAVLDTLYRQFCPVPAGESP